MRSRKRVKAMLFHLTPLDVAIVSVVIGAILIGLLTLIVTLARAALHGFEIGSTPRNLILSGGAAAAIALAAFFVVRADALDSLERDCRDHILADPRMAGVSHLSAEQHHDIWNYTTTYGGWVAPQISQPHTVPKVIMVVKFYRDDNRIHDSWIECLYKTKPDSGNPPRLLFDQVKYSFENMLEDNHWVPWHPATPPTTR
jgi:hypothetical protein